MLSSSDLFFFFFCFGPHLTMLRFTPGSTLRNYFWQACGTLWDAGDRTLVDGSMQGKCPLCCVKSLAPQWPLWHNICAVSWKWFAVHRFCRDVFQLTNSVFHWVSQNW